VLKREKESGSIRATNAKGECCGFRKKEIPSAWLKGSVIKSNNILINYLLL